MHIIVPRPSPGCGRGVRTQSIGDAGGNTRPEFDYEIHSQRVAEAFEGVQARIDTALFQPCDRWLGAADAASKLGLGDTRPLARCAYQFTQAERAGSGVVRFLGFRGCQEFSAEIGPCLSCHVVSFSSSSSGVWPAAMQCAIAATARATSARSRIRDLVNTVSRTMRRPGRMK